MYLLINVTQEITFSICEWADRKNHLRRPHVCFVVHMYTVAFLAAEAHKATVGSTFVEFSRVYSSYTWGVHNSTVLLLYVNPKRSALVLPACFHVADFPFLTVADGSMYSSSTCYR